MLFKFMTLALDSDWWQSDFWIVGLTYDGTFGYFFVSFSEYAGTEKILDLYAPGARLFFFGGGNVDLYSSQVRASNPGQMCGNPECYPCAMPRPPQFGTIRFFIKSDSRTSRQSNFARIELSDDRTFGH